MDVDHVCQVLEPLRENAFVTFYHRHDVYTQGVLPLRLPVTLVSVYSILPRSIVYGFFVYVVDSKRRLSGLFNKESDDIPQLQVSLTDQTYKVRK